MTSSLILELTRKLIIFRMHAPNNRIVSSNNSVSDKYIYIYIPIHLSCPFLENPCLQTHSKDPSVFLHFAVAKSQL